MKTFYIQGYVTIPLATGETSTRVVHHYVEEEDNARAVDIMFQEQDYSKEHAYCLDVIECVNRKLFKSDNLESKQKYSSEERIKELEKEVASLKQKNPHLDVPIVVERRVKRYKGA